MKRKRCNLGRKKGWERMSDPSADGMPGYSPCKGTLMPKLVVEPFREISKLISTLDSVHDTLLERALDTRS